MMLYKKKCPTILHAAAINKHSDVLLRFLKKGVFVDACNNQKRTPLHCAVECGDIKSVKILVKYKASLIIVDDWQ